jgi:hypothetical protein
MKGGCRVRNGKRDDSELLPRQSEENQTFESSSDILHSWGNMSYVYVPLEDLRNGHYSMDVNFDAEVQGIQVLDRDGEELYAVEAVSNRHSVDFAISGVDDEDPVPAGLFLDVQKAIDVSYSATATPTSADSATESDIASRVGRMSLGLGIPIAWMMGWAL